MMGSDVEINAYVINDANAMLEKGDNRGYYHPYSCYVDDKSQFNDLEITVRYLEQGSKNNYPIAKKGLAILLVKGLIGEQRPCDYKMAYELLEEAVSSPEFPTHSFDYLLMVDCYVEGADEILFSKAFDVFSEALHLLDLSDSKNVGVINDYCAKYFSKLSLISLIFSAEKRKHYGERFTVKSYTDTLQFLLNTECIGEKIDSVSDEQNIEIDNALVEEMKKYNIE